MTQEQKTHTITPKTYPDKLPAWKSFLFASLSIVIMLILVELASFGILAFRGSIRGPFDLPQLVVPLFKLEFPPSRAV